MHDVPLRLEVVVVLDYLSGLIILSIGHICKRAGILQKSGISTSPLLIWRVVQSRCTLSKALLLFVAWSLSKTSAPSMLVTLLVIVDASGFVREADALHIISVRDNKKNVVFPDHTDASLSTLSTAFLTLDKISVHTDPAVSVRDALLHVGTADIKSRDTRLSERTEVDVWARVRRGGLQNFSSPSTLSRAKKKEHKQRTTPAEQPQDSAPWHDGTCRCKTSDMFRSTASIPSLGWRNNHNRLPRESGKRCQFFVMRSQSHLTTRLWCSEVLERVSWNPLVLAVRLGWNNTSA